MEHFNTQNTQGFTKKTLERMNEVYERETNELSDEDRENTDITQHISEKICDKFSHCLDPKKPALIDHLVDGEIVSTTYEPSNTSKIFRDTYDNIHYVCPEYEWTILFDDIVEIDQNI